jgi:ABC-type nickel/cobalt efflux system permease component RcnA
LLTTPLNHRTIAFRSIPLAVPDQQTNDLSYPLPRPQLNLPANRNDGFTQLITAENLSPLTLLIALALSFGWGAAHALTPGHGKSIVAAYLVGSRGTTRHALFLGLTTTATHTVGVFALGFLTLFAARFILPEQLYPWLGVASGVLVAVMGGSLLGERLSRLKGEHFHAHDHSHPHDHHHPHDHNHDHGHTHTHLPPGANGSAITWRGLLALGVSGGLIPCPSALVVMLSAIALQRIGFGLLLIVAFSLGLASVLTLIGILWVHAGRLFNRVPSSGRLFWVLPIGSALFIAVIGLGMALQALLQTGILPAEVVTLALSLAKL